jgi:hypothetical protein
MRDGHLHGARLGVDAGPRDLHLMTRLLVLSLLLAGCHSSGIRFTDADVYLDPGREPDVPPDSPPDTVDSPSEPDVGPPDLIDVEPPCDSITGGTCSLLEQCGCTPGFACDLGVDPATCTIVETCVAGSGLTDVEEACTGAGQCRPGTICLTRLIEETSYCFEWCGDDPDCSVPGRECAITVSTGLPPPCTGTAELPYRVCTFGCPPDEGCELFATGPDPTGCPSGQACFWDTIITGGGCDVARCFPEGTGDPGDDCSSERCRRGSGCYGAIGEGFFCRPYCDDAHACTTGTCTSYGSPPRPDLGVCMP